MLLQKKSGDGQEFLSRKKLSRKKLSIFVSKVGPANGVRNISIERHPVRSSPNDYTFKFQKLYVGIELSQRLIQTFECCDNYVG